jgi:dsDNA-specific endonuclease/ATPase MutS2
MENAENFEARQAYEKQYYLQNKEKYLERKRQFRQNFPEKERRYIKDYKASHRDQINAYHRKWKAKKRIEDVQFKLKMNMSRRIRYELNTMDRTKQKKNKGTVEYIKCTAGFLKNHLEARGGKIMDGYGTSITSYLVITGIWRMRGKVTCAGITRICLLYGLL